MKIIPGLLFFVCVGCAGQQARLSYPLCGVPITVMAEPSVAGPVSEAAEKAVAYWNREIESDVFLWVESEPADVRIVWGHPAMMAPRTVGKIRYALTIEYTEGQCTRMAEIRVAPDVVVYEAGLIGTILRHELGHVLGLDDTPGSIDVMGDLDRSYGWDAPTHPMVVWGPQLDLLRDTY